MYQLITIISLFLLSIPAQANAGQFIFGCNLDLEKNYQVAEKVSSLKEVYFQDKKLIHSSPDLKKDYCYLTAVDRGLAVACANLNDCKDPKGKWTSLTGLPGKIEKDSSYAIDPKGNTWAATPKGIADRFGWTLHKNRDTYNLNCYTTHGEKIQGESMVIATPPKPEFFQSVMGDCIKSVELNH